MNSEFKPIPGYENRYVINEDGIVKRIERFSTDTKNRTYFLKELQIKEHLGVRSGYPEVKLTRPNGRYGNQYIHRLVALTFIPNPYNKKLVNHIDGNKLNCHRSNLEWVTPSENHLHAIKNKLCNIPAHNKTKVIDICTGKTYKTIKEAAIAFDIKCDVMKVLLRCKDRLPCLQRA